MIKIDDESVEGISTRVLRRELWASSSAGRQTVNIEFRDESGSLLNASIEARVSAGLIGPLGSAGLLGSAGGWPAWFGWVDWQIGSIRAACFSPCSSQLAERTDSERNRATQRIHNQRSGFDAGGQR